jgi:hypothetical protein
MTLLDTCVRERIIFQNKTILDIKNHSNLSSGYQYLNKSFMHNPAVVVKHSRNNSNTENHYQNTWRGSNRAKQKWDKI